MNNGDVIINFFIRGKVHLIQMDEDGDVYMEDVDGDHAIGDPLWGLKEERETVEDLPFAYVMTNGSGGVVVGAAASARTYLDFHVEDPGFFLFCWTGTNSGERQMLLSNREYDNVKTILDGDVRRFKYVRGKYRPHELMPFSRVSFYVGDEWEDVP